MSRTYLDDDFLLHSPTARTLYHEVAAGLPIIDYHCHLPPQEIAENIRWETITDLWLGADHYKWRAMRSNGVPEELVTGNGDPKEKFFAYADTIAHAFRNPLFDWTHLELRRYFGIEEVLSTDSAQAIWDACNEKLKEPAFCAHEILKDFKVEVIGTTDDPADDLADHHAIAKHPDITTCVAPTFRPDKALRVDDTALWNGWLDSFQARIGEDIGSFSQLVEALGRRHDEFHAAGARLSDHGASHCHPDACSAAEAEAIFARARSGEAATADQHDAFAGLLMRHVGRWNAEKNWTTQLHINVLRNTNKRMFAEVGPDTGFDTMADFPQGDRLIRYLDALDRDNHLPKTVLYGLNPRDFDLFASMMGAFQTGTTPGKIQLGSGWWFNDTKRGMLHQLNALSDNGLLSRFVGMLTDSRSFLSYPRHEYFRRILCNLIGGEVDAGELPNDRGILDKMVRGICYENARAYFGFPCYT